MPSKKYFKIAIDIGMLLMFLLLIGAHLTPAALHEWFGIGLFLCFLVHNILNYRWYKALFKGKYMVLRTIQTTVNLLLLLAVIGCIISALMISGVVFRDIRLPGKVNPATHKIGKYALIVLILRRQGKHHRGIVL